MSSSVEKELIVQYWYRILLESQFSIEDITTIIIEFANEYEQFNALLKHADIELDNENTTIFTTKRDVVSRERCSTFGTIIANPGRKYHWKLELMGVSHEMVNIGITEDDKCENMLDEFWWNEPWGYSYYGYSGNFFHGTAKEKTYGERFGAGDIVDIWLDLKDNNDISFGMNGKRFIKVFDVKLNVNYRLAVSMN